MNKEKVSRIMDLIDEKYINEAGMIEADEKSASADRPHRLRWGWIAACLALIAVIGSMAFAYTAEAREYNDAVAFFEENGLPAEGLRRAEVKAVYRDITERRFTYGKTAEVIQHAVTGIEIPQEEPTAEEIAALWDSKNRMDTTAQNDITFCIDPQYVYDEAKGFEILDRCILECLQGGETLWSAEFADYIEGYEYTKDGTAVWGRNDIWSSENKEFGWIAIVDRKGNVKWQKKLDHDFGYEYVGDVLSNGDGTWAVISRGELEYLCLSTYDDAGNEIGFRKTQVGNLGIWNVARLGDGFIVQMGNLTSHDTARIYKMDRYGNVTDFYSYEAEDTQYYITDMAEFEGRIYLSAYSVPTQSDKGGRHEIANILEYIFSKENWSITDEELTPLLRDNYTAVLFICNPEGGLPQTFYSVKGSLGGKLSADGSGRLEWDVESIYSSFFSPATSSFTIGAACKVFRYIFDGQGSLVGQTDTGETTQYRR